jgi:hypothetical protein
MCNLGDRPLRLTRAAARPQNSEHRWVPMGLGGTTTRAVGAYWSIGPERYGAALS